jgi:hypothetical protein
LSLLNEKPCVSLSKKLSPGKIAYLLESLMPLFWHSMLSIPTIFPASEVPVCMTLLVTARNQNDRSEVTSNCIILTQHFMKISYMFTNFKKVAHLRHNCRQCDDLVACLERHVSEVALLGQQIWSSVGNHLVEAHIHSNTRANRSRICRSRCFLCDTSLAAYVEADSSKARERETRGPKRSKRLKGSQLKPRLGASATETGRLEGRPVREG